MRKTTVEAVLRPKEAAEYAGCHVKTLLRALRRGDLVGHQRVAGGSWRIFESDLIAWIKGESPKRRRTA
ncbi:helix-turn-helix domain-containing protein [Saccharomonospora cyanea]|uniref:DNA-binding protein, excisionase family n=1 Tax=Saccharomonospora cyanea NA-134 TaxID=882082 RepID=H5XG72_9PSEU|nr:helix-turn-helix domain-containing protein [Saccharomonospora cyanea]EHR62654.1 DNA-binding protein, excisionase family [Saccharomonospora cyanea NA-134]